MGEKKFGVEVQKFGLGIPGSHFTHSLLGLLTLFKLWSRVLESCLESMSVSS